ncbi:hypothetical protein TrVE_jg11467 [Triparma verrucosa]|uniref:Uncharacterized protein n=1 Tax=Triparma verrucosa TaxID=1606542 RepID=A0A9W7C6B2_9STRA|nr:hypothetical protein TrVE_jg11467 [Triparma verrucosa]
MSSRTVPTQVSEVSEQARLRKESTNATDDSNVSTASPTSSSTKKSTALLTKIVSDFIHTEDFHVLFLPYIPVDTLMSMMSVSRQWKVLVEKSISEKVKTSDLVVLGNAHPAHPKNIRLVTRVVFLLNVTRIPLCRCSNFCSLSSLDIPEGVSYIGEHAFENCFSLKTATFPSTLRTISTYAFSSCISLESVDLRHTRLEDIGSFAFRGCAELSSMRLPDSPIVFGQHSFARCFKLVPEILLCPRVSAYNNKRVACYLRASQD